MFPKIESFGFTALKIQSFDFGFTLWPKLQLRNFWLRTHVCMCLINRVFLLASFFYKFDLVWQY